tara:strand:- start:550 stop:957 length:408 start_codon:yes stop_codon:yes gene_type:complete
MQTFLPYADFEKSAKCLDYRRLGKQRVEAWQIHQIVSGQRKKGGWINHPAVNMWRGFSNLLAYYYNDILDEWIKRGYKNTMEYIMVPPSITEPLWLGNKDFHDSHKSNLLRKDLNFYSQYGWDVPNNLDYVWEVK